MVLEFSRVVHFLYIKLNLAGIEAVILSRLKSFWFLNYLFLMLINIFMEGNFKDIDNVSRFTVVHGPNTANYGGNYESK